MDITLSGDVDGDGVTDSVSMLTNADGEYWFEDLAPGSYTVSETPPAGIFPTTATSFTVSVAAGVELVALAGQAHLDPNDPRTEEVVGPRLAFGNAFEGSIHGFKFLDANGNGVWGPNEGPLGGVTIVLEWTDADGNTQTAMTRTDAQGEYWFEWLEPGLTYTVSEVAPARMNQTTDNPDPIFIGSGQEYVADDEQGAAVQRRISFPWWWHIEIVPEGQDESVTLMVEGMAEFAFSDLVDVETGETIPLVNARDGLPLSLPEGRTFVYDTEILSMDLSGIDPSTGHSVRVVGQGRGRGVVRNEGGVLVGGFGRQFNVDSFFDITYRIEFTDEPHVEIEKPVRPVVDPLLAFGNRRIADLTGDGFVDFGDLTLQLAHWDERVTATLGNFIDPATTPINFQDLTFLLAGWTGPGPAASPQGAAAETSVPRATSGSTPDTATTESRIATNAHFDRLGRRDRATLRRTSHTTPLRRLQAAAVDRAMVEETQTPAVSDESVFVRRRRR